MVNHFLLLVIAGLLATTLALDFQVTVLEATDTGHDARISALEENGKVLLKNMSKIF